MKRVVKVGENVVISYCGRYGGDKEIRLGTIVEVLEGKVKIIVLTNKEKNSKIKLDIESKRFKTLAEINDFFPEKKEKKEEKLLF